MRISVVVVSYNQAAFLGAAICSVVEQDYEDKEVFVLDGGSRDGSVDVIRQFSPRLSFWRSQPDGGQSMAITDGFAMCSGGIIGWLNSDDILTPGALRRVAQRARRAGTEDALFYGGSEVIDETGVVQEVFPPTPAVSWITRAIGPTICQPGTFFGRAAYEAVGGVNPALHYAMDFDLWLRLVTRGFPLLAISATQGQFRRHAMQKGHSLEWLRKCEEEERVLQREYGLQPRGSLGRSVALQAQRALVLVRGNILRTVAHRLVRHGRLREFASAYSA